MPTIIAHHNVKDTKHWLASPKRKEIYEPLGMTNIRTFVTPKTPPTWQCSRTSPTWTP